MLSGFLVNSCAQSCVVSLRAHQSLPCPFGITTRPVSFWTLNTWLALLSSDTSLSVTCACERASLMSCFQPLRAASARLRTAVHQRCVCFARRAVRAWRDAPGRPHHHARYSCHVAVLRGDAAYASASSSWQLQARDSGSTGCVNGSLCDCTTRVGHTNGNLTGNEDLRPCDCRAVNSCRTAESSRLWDPFQPYGRNHPFVHTSSAPSVSVQYFIRHFPRRYFRSWEVTATI